MTNIPRLVGEALADQGEVTDKLALDMLAKFVVSGEDAVDLLKMGEAGFLRVVREQARNANRRRLAAKARDKGPRFNVGELVYDGTSNHNTAVVGVNFDEIAMEWRISVPGVNAPDYHFRDPIDGEPLAVYKKSSPGWALVSRETWTKP